jgi:hypothetical protein
MPQLRQEIERRRHVHRAAAWSRLALCCALATVIELSDGCGHAPPPAERESPLTAQVAAVQRGQSKWLRLDQTIVHDRDLDAIEGIEDKIERVNFSHTDLTDEGLALLCRCLNLEQLRVSSPRLTDQGMTHLAGLKKLRFLHLLDAPISDAGLEWVHGLSSLESVYLDRTRVSDEGIARLLSALPKVHLHLDDHHHALDSHAKDHQHGDERSGGE